MGYYISAATGEYYEGDEASPNDISVPERPGLYYIWENGAWVSFTPQLSQADTATFILNSRAAMLQQQANKIQASDPVKAVSLFFQAQGLKS